MNFFKKLLIGVLFNLIAGSAFAEWSGTLDPNLIPLGDPRTACNPGPCASSGAIWLWTPHGVTGYGDNSQGLWAIGANLNVWVSGASPDIETKWINNTGHTIKIVRINSTIGTEFRGVLKSAAGQTPVTQGGFGAPVGQFSGSVHLQEAPFTCDCRLPLLIHGPSVFYQSGYLDWSKDTPSYAPGTEPIVKPGDAIWFRNNTYWPYANPPWNEQDNFIVYFQFVTP